MTRNSTIVRPLLMLTAALFSTSLAASEPLSVAGEPVQPVYQESVDFADLDLRQAAAQKTLTQRVQVAARKVCFRNALSAPRLPMQGTCFAATYKSAKPGVDAAIRLALAGQVQTAMSLVVSRVAPPLR
jgi:UrcA family protein